MHTHSLQLPRSRGTGAPAGGAPVNHVGVGAFVHPVVASEHWASAVRMYGAGAQGFGPASTPSVVPASALFLHPSGATAAAAEYFAGLKSASERIAMRHGLGTCRQEQVFIGEFADWLSQLPPAWGRSLSTVVPEDILSFMDGHWVRRHGRTAVPGDESLRSSYSGAKGALLHLEHYLEIIGRGGEWDPFSGRGNPCRSFLVRQWRPAYERTLWRAGVRPVAATPLMVGDVCKLAAACVAGSTALEVIPHDSAAGSLVSRAAVTHAVRARNAMMVYYNHESGQRGGEVRYCAESPRARVAHCTVCDRGILGIKLHVVY